MTINNNIGILTLGYGADRYIEMSIRLAQSLIINSPNYPRAIVSDRCVAELSQYFDIVIPYNSDYGRNLEQKLHLDLYTPFERTMFIDADCLVTRNLDFAFEMFQGHTLTTTESKTVSRDYSDPNFELNINKVLDYFNIETLQRFNGGVYYFEQSDMCTTVFNQARKILKYYPKLGIREFRNCGPNEEILISISMRLNNINSIDDNGLIMRTPIGINGGIKIDVLNNISQFNKGDKIVYPAILHYCGKWVLHPTYVRETFKLKHTFESDGNFGLKTKILMNLIFTRAKLKFFIFRFLKRWRGRFERLRSRILMFITH